MINILLLQTPNLDRYVSEEDKKLLLTIYTAILWVELTYPINKLGYIPQNIKPENGH